MNKLPEEPYESFAWYDEAAVREDEMLDEAEGIDDPPPLCYMGHENCWDLHTNERLADEADWEQERLEEMGHIDFIERPHRSTTPPRLKPTGKT